MVGKWFRRRLTWAMGIYALVMSVGFMLAFPAVGALVLASGWRVAWAAVGICLVAVVAPVSWIFTRSTPESAGQEMDGESPGGRSERLDKGHDAPGCARHHRVLGVRAGQFALRPGRVGYRALQRVSARGARIRAGDLPPGAGGDGDHRPCRQLRGRRLGRARIAARGARGRHGGARRRARGAAARVADLARHGASGGHGRRGRIRDGGVLQLLGPHLRPGPSRTDTRAPRR